ncbi:MAG: proline--tRNA ligase [Acidimicrobiales bacterium]
MRSMRWSSLFAPTLRDAPGDAEAVSHKLLVRGGFIRQLHAGHYTYLPLGYRVRSKIIRIIEEEMDAIGGQRIQVPTMHPASVWQESGRWDSMGEVMFRLEDRHGAPNALGVTAEEIFATVAREITSYKQLPQMWYQINTKFRDEARPKSGLLRIREFTMKHAYSLDLDEAGLGAAFNHQHDAYVKIFERFGLESIAVEASSGNMGGTDSVEFMVRADAGEDDVVVCPNCDYAANIEKAISALPAVVDAPGLEAPEKFPTPGIRTIAALAEIAPADRQIKTMVYVVDGHVTLALLRGDHQLNEQKLADTTQANVVRPATPEEAREALGAMPGSLGAVGVEGLRILSDRALDGRQDMTTGANEDDWHYRGVDIGRDIDVGEGVGLRQGAAGGAWVNCGTALDIVPTIEAGHIFKLGTKYAETFGALVLDSDGKQRPIVMGSYGIGVDRAIATIVETHHDDNGIIWPASVAPFEVVITIVQMRDEPSVAAATDLYEELVTAGIEVLLDDRDARPGVKFADAELIGFQHRIGVGPRALAEGSVEYTPRATGETTLVPLDEVVASLTETVRSAR